MGGSHQKWSGLWHCFTHMVQLSDGSIFLEFPLPNGHGPWWCWKRGADAVATCDGDQQVFAGSKPLGEELHFLKYIYIYNIIYIILYIYNIVYIYFTRYIYIIHIYYLSIYLSIYIYYIILYILYIYNIYIYYIYLISIFGVHQLIKVLIVHSCRICVCK